MAEYRVCDTAVGELIVPSGDWMLESLVADGTYEPYVLGPLLDAINASSVVLDVGANIGFFTVAAARRAARVIAVEAAADNVRLIAANVERQQLSNVDIFPVAASDRLEMATFFEDGITTDKVMRPRALSLETINETGVALGAPLDMIVPGQVDVIKMDIEGREYAALQGMPRLLSTRPLVFIEFSPDFIRDGTGASADAFLDLFFDLGYQATVLHRDMTREQLGHDHDRILSAWRDYMSRSITHLDLVFAPLP